MFDGHAYSVLKFEKVDDIYGKEHQLVQGKKIKFQLVVKNETKFLLNRLVRNPWGAGIEYSGDWSDKSSLWKGSKFNSQLLITAFSIIYRFFYSKIFNSSPRKTLRKEEDISLLNDAEDGSFWMSYEDWRKYFDAFQVKKPKLFNFSA